MDLDDWDSWCPSFEQHFESLSGRDLVESICSKDLEYREHYIDEIIDTLGAFEVYTHINKWVNQHRFLLFHATRLTQMDEMSILSNGLIPFNEQDMWSRITWIINETRDEKQREISLSKARREYEAESDRDGDKVFFCYSRRELMAESSHYLTFGSETLLVIIGRSVGRDGKDFFRKLTNPAFVICPFKGDEISELAKLDLSTDILEKGNIPSLENTLLDVWCSWKRGITPTTDLHIGLCHIQVGRFSETAGPLCIQRVDERNIQSPDPYLWT